MASAMEIEQGEGASGSTHTQLSEEKEAEMADNGAASSANAPIQTPACLLIGMAGSGKTTLVDALSSYIENADDLAETLAALELSDDTAKAAQQSPELNGDGAFVLNLDPAVHEVPYEPNIDIRDTVDYKKVMKDYSLGPNGAILTSLNLYATRFDQVLTILEKRAAESRAVVIDTPGQIETFTWSASGTIITDALAMTLPTVIVFVVDTHRSRNAMTFVSNMLYACSIMYKTRLPMVVAFNKTDVASCKFAQAWMQDFDQFDAALKEENFVGTLARSMAMALEEFYKAMRSVGVSANTGEGVPQLVHAIRDAAREYEREYRPWLEERKRKRGEEERMRAQAQLAKFKQDVGGGSGQLEGERQEEEDDGMRTGDTSMLHGRQRRQEQQGRARRHEERLAKLKGEVDEYDDEEERQAYEDLKKYLDAIKGKSKK